MSRFHKLIDSFGIGVIFGGLCLVFSVLSSDFYSAWNLSQILVQTSFNIIIATGMTYVISAAEIDLSVGSLLGVCSILVAFIMKVDPQTGLNLPMALSSTLLSPFPDLLPGAVSWWIVSTAIFLVLALLPGLLGGALVGFIVVRFAVPSFIVTLGFMMIYRGLARYLTDAQQIFGMPTAFMKLGSDPICTVYD
ncbi:hypothetical protein GF373_12640, partial [bacterium]|nr:hypothetical protein [bacterium]